MSNNLSSASALSGGPTSTYASGPSRNTGEYNNYIRSLMSRISDDYNRRRDLESEENETTPTARSGLYGEPIVVDAVEFYARDNARVHVTDRYELVIDNQSPTPVLRRGMPFYFAMRFRERGIDFKKDTMKVVMSFGPNSSVAKGTKIILPVVGQGKFGADGQQWDVRVDRQERTMITLQIQIPPTAHVGIWRCQLVTGLVNFRDRVSRFKCKEDIYVLFNPFSKDDPVYLEDPMLRAEYVMNDTGKVWMGSYRSIRGRRWAFGQFDDVVLPAAMYLLEVSQLNHNERNSPVKIVRALSAVVNSVDDDGLLVGRWDGDYKDGTAPYSWTGSVAILEEFLKNGGKSVKYGQCWVFSALTVTLCRALGIGCRTLTNYVSAHDTNHTLTVDKYFDKEGEEIVGGPDGECFDSLWNFHVWNDVWMARKDLPAGYGGWQAIDATPQEESDSKMQCGPASVEAVRKGEVGFLYDTPFVFSEVNADVCHFQADTESDWGFSRIKINQYHVGRKIVTKRPDKDDDDGDDDMEDITHQYKNTEGSAAERMVVFNAVRGVEKAHQQYNYPAGGTEDVVFDLIELEKVPYGEDFHVTVEIENKADSQRTVSAILSACSVYYTGVKAHTIRKAQGEFVLQPKQKEVLRLTVSQAEYMDKLVDYTMCKIYALCSVTETHQTWSEEDDFVLEKPNLDIQIKGSPQIRQRFDVTFSFTNPLKVRLTDCKFSFEGPGLVRPRILPFRNVEVGEKVTHTEAFYPKRIGTWKIIGTFSSRQIMDVTGSKTVQVSQ